MIIGVTDMDALKKATSQYAGKRILITGCNGFKGSWLTFWLHSLGANILGIGLDTPSNPCMFNILQLDELVKIQYVDIRNQPVLSAVMESFQPKIIFHMAAQALVRPSYEDPLGTLETNIMGTANVLEACRHCDSVCAVLIITSDKCYRNNEWVWGYRENDPMGGHDPYSASKGCAELITASYRNSFFPAEKYGLNHTVALASARAGNAIGGGDWGKDRLIPDCFRAMSRGESVQIRFPKAVRPWQHVLECLSGYLQLGAALLTEGPKYASGWNFAPNDMGDVWPVERVVRYICNMWGQGSYEIINTLQPHEAHMLCLDSTKANIELGWRPRLKVAQALELTTKWYKAWAENSTVAHMRSITQNQIKTYTKTYNMI